MKPAAPVIPVLTSYCSLMAHESEHPYSRESISGETAFSRQHPGHKVGCFESRTSAQDLDSEFGKQDGLGRSFIASAPLSDVTTSASSTLKPQPTIPVLPPASLFFRT